MKSDYKILVIDDEELIRESVADFLEDIGYTVIQGENGEHGIEVFGLENPDLVLVDLRMPQVDGFGVLEYITNKTNLVPVIVVSGTGAIQDVIQALRLGAWGFVTKPIEDLAVLEYTIKQALEKVQLQRENDKYHKHLEQEIESRTKQLKEELSERRKTEIELQKLNEELEERVSQRTQALQDSLQSLKQAQSQLVESEKLAALGALVAGVAHEINTPIGTGVTAASFLEEDTQRIIGLYESETMRKQDFEEYLRIAKQSSRTILTNLNRAAELIKSFKQVAVDQSTESKRKFNLKSYIEGVLLSLHPKYKKYHHQINLNCDENISIESYPGAFSQIITNLIMNSLYHAFTDNNINGEINIDFKINNSKLNLVYSDNGIGMNKETLHRIYEPFYTTRRGSGGSGLGMHIVYNLATQTLLGDIKTESIPGSGTTITINIPL